MDKKGLRSQCFALKSHLGDVSFSTDLYHIKRSASQWEYSDSHIVTEGQRSAMLAASRGDPDQRTPFLFPAARTVLSTGDSSHF
jgi:hypothetical protein